MNNDELLKYLREQNAKYALGRLKDAIMELEFAGASFDNDDPRRVRIDEMVDELGEMVDDAED